MPPTMIPIELDDEAPPPSPPARSRLGRRTGRRLAIGVVVLALALIAGQRAADARAQTSWNRLSDRTNVVLPVGRSLSVLWSPDVSDVLAIGRGAAWRGSVVAPVANADGSRSVAAIRDRDGRRAWTTSVIGPDARRATDSEATVVGGSCERVPDDASRVVCLVTDALVLPTAQSGSTQQPPHEVHLVVVDPRDGRLVADHAIAPDLSTLSAVLPGPLAVIVSSSGGQPEVAGLDLVTGQERWRTVAPSLGAGSGSTAVRVGSAVAVIGDRGVDVVGPDGTLRRSVPVTGGLGYVALVDGRIVVPDQGGSLVVGEDRDVRLSGSPVWVSSYDGSLPGMTLLLDPGMLHAYDEDGTPRWQLPGASATSVAVLRGVVYVTRDGGVTAVDGTTGSVRWQATLPVQQLGAVTDGRVLLTALSREVVALDLRTGAQLWRAPLPSGHTRPWVLHGLLVATDEGGGDTVALG